MSNNNEFISSNYIFKIIEQYLDCNDKAIRYYEQNKINFDSMLKMRQENSCNTEKVLNHMVDYCTF